jgi:hypothetical protein
LAKADKRKHLITYIKATKNIVLHNIGENNSNLIQIHALPFNFYDLSSAIDYSENLSTILISGGKQDNLIYSEASNAVWAYNLVKKELYKAFELVHGLSYHGGVFINNFFFLIGGRNNAQFFDEVYRVNVLLPFSKITKVSSRLNTPRASFGVGVVNHDLIYVFFGIENDNSFLNSIEVIDTMKHSKIAKLIEIKNEQFRLKHPGILFNIKSQSFIILGGKSPKNMQNKQILELYKDTLATSSTYNDKLLSFSTFSSLSICLDSYSYILSNERITGEDPYLYSYCSSTEKWTFSALNI